MAVAAAAASTLSASAPASATAGTSFNVTVTAKDAYGNTATSYTGTVHFTSSDSAAVLPGNYTFVSGDAGRQHVQRHPEDRRQPDRDRHRYGHWLDHRYYRLGDRGRRRGQHVVG